MEEVLQARQSSLPVRLTCNKSSSLIKNFLIEKLQLTKNDVYEVDGIIDLTSLAKLSELTELEHLKFPKWKPCLPKEFDSETSIWDEIKKQDLMLHTPYESFDPVLRMVNESATDPNVLAIKITLYRTSGNSPIVKALEVAARNGKQVTVFIELKARFDEKQNIEWATRLQNAGVIVIYGIVNLKVHAKMMMIVRKEEDGILRYVHLSTGNYNENTAKLYSDISIFTVEPEIANDATLFFNMISGYSAIQTMQQIKIAPINLKSSLISLIEREIQNSSPEKPGLIIAKMNSLAHPEIIKALYKASCNNVKIKLNIRGICMLVPGVKGLSENIQVTSIIDRYLEHSRICYFQNGGNEEVYLSSADWMPRNLDRRVEILFPILSESIFTRLKSILNNYLGDTENSSILDKKGNWTQISQLEEKLKSDKKFSAQKYFHEKAQKLQKFQKDNFTSEFIVRR
jgi:polyphosphate kinase